MHKNSRPRIALIGSGNIGGTLAHLAALEGEYDIVLLDRNHNIAAGKALDLAQAGAIMGTNVQILGTSNYEDIAGANVVIVTAGVPRKPGMSRDDLLSVNSEVMHTVAQGVKQFAPNAFVIVVTNPLDVMVYAFQKHSGLPAHKVVGMAGLLDSGRFSYFLAQELEVSVEDISAIVMGGHGDTMVPLIRYSSIAGIPLSTMLEMNLISQARLDEIIARTRNGGAEIVQLLQTGSAFYAPAAAALTMAKAYLFDQRKLITAAAYLTGEYGIDGLYLGVPVIIGSGGVEKILDLPLNEKEQQMFDKSVASVKELIFALSQVQA